MGRNIYQLMVPATTDTDDYGESYADIFTLDLSQFIFTKRPISYALTLTDIERWDLLMLRIYGVVDYYDKIVLWINNIGFLDSTYEGTEIILPSKKDIENFYFHQIKGE